MILIAKDQKELAAWTGLAVVIDVLIDATALCSLVASGREEIRVFADESKFDKTHNALSSAEIWAASCHSLKEPANRLKNLLHVRTYQKTFVLLEKSTAQAVWALRQARGILLGGFCNFQALQQVLKNEENDVLLVPGALFEAEDDVEDVLCAEVLKESAHGPSFPKEAISNFYATLRAREYVNSSLYAKENLKLATHLDGLPVVPSLRFAQDGSYAVCVSYNPADYQKEEVNKTLYKTQLAMDLKDMSSLFVKGKKNSSAKAETSPEKSMDTLPAEESEEKSVSSDSIRISKQEGTFLAFLPKHPSGSTANKKSFPKEEAKKTIDLADAPTASISMSQTPKEIAVAESVSEFAPELSPKAPALSEGSVPKAPVLQTFIAASQKAAWAKTVLADKSVRKAIVLFSGGLDSATCLYWTLEQGYTCEALTVSYGQRHDREIKSAQQITQKLGVKHHLITLDLPWLQTSSLVDKSAKIPDVPVEQIPYEGIPSTYVPGRNLMFLAIAGSLLDSVGADAIIAGPNAVDFSGYPDCTPIFFQAAADALNYGTKQGVQGGISVLAPLMNLSKAEIVSLAQELHVPFELTWSCYNGGEKPCGHCDSCKLRAKGFAEAGVHDTSLD